MKKRGFTLVELIAVIAVLAIIITVTMTSVSSLINKNKKKIFERNIDGLVKTANIYSENKYESDKTNGFYVFTYNDGKLLFGTNEVKTDNSMKDVTGSFSLDDAGNVYIGTFYVPKKYCLVIDNNNKTYRDIKQINSLDDCVSTYKETILNGSIPELSDGMIPVTIADDGTVTKADLYSEWYSYTNKKWANMIIVNKTSRDKYMTAPANQTITPSDILGYFVWIPRYKYKLFNSTTPVEINIEFENRYSQKSLNTNSGEWRTHPGFTFGNEELNGLWYGKFETGYYTVGYDDILSIRPDTYPPVNELMSEHFALVQDFNDTDYYGINNDAHIAKNTEWGAVTYLTESKYGRCTGSTCIEVSRNNHFNMYSGYGEVHKATTAFSSTSISTNEFGNTSSVTLPYNTNSGYLASTTGNITGIYDMSGGAEDRVMAVLLDSITKKPIVSKSGFTSDTLPDSKYYDTYTSEDENTACDGEICYGQALSETKGWFDDAFYFATSYNPWIDRGGQTRFGTSAGIFACNFNNGNGKDEYNFRTVLVP